LTCHNGRAGPDHSGNCFEYANIAVARGTPKQNKSNNFWVIVGFNYFLLVGGAYAENSLPIQWTIQDPSGHDVDEVVNVNFDYIAAPASGVVSFRSELVMRKLVPPGHFVNIVGGGAPSTPNFQIVSCPTLDHAVDVL